MTLQADCTAACRSIGRRVGESVNSTSLCLPYTDCPADAFNVMLPPSAFSDLNLPAIDMLQIFDSNGPGKLGSNLHQGSMSAFKQSLPDDQE